MERQSERTDGESTGVARYDIEGMKPERAK